VHASPTYHAIYRIARDEVLTQTTLVELQHRKIDIQTPMDFAEVYFHGPDYLMGRMQAALEELYRHPASASPIKLTARQCIALLALVDLKGYRRNEQIPYTTRPHIYGDQHFECITHDRFAYPCGEWRKYHLMGFGSSSREACKAISMQLGQAHSMNARNVRNERKQLAATAKMDADYLKLHPPTQIFLSLSAISSVEIAPTAHSRASSSSKGPLDAFVKRLGGSKKLTK